MNKYTLDDSPHNRVDDYEDVLDVRKAHAFASWSYLGLLIPFLGWILAIVSLSISRNLPEHGKIGLRRERARNSAKLSIFLSIISALIYLAVALHSGSAKEQPVTDQSQADNQSTMQQQDSSQSDLQSCISQAHQQWDGTIAIAEGGIDQEPYNFDKSQLDQQINNCNIQYSTN